ncbi:MAG: homoaconitase [Acidobacteriota bacterium]
MGQTAIEKIAWDHMIDGPRDRPLRAGDFISIRPRHVMTHDNSAAVMKKFRVIGAGRLFDSRQPVFALDHDIQNRSPSNLAKYREIEAFALDQGVDFYPAGSGIGHQIMVERGYVVPTSCVVASDSHSNMYGALAALGTPVVRTDAAAIWATGQFWWQIPATVQVVLRGRLGPGVTGKDVIIALCGLYNQGEVLNRAVEFSGTGVAGLSMSERFTISNMTTEWGPLTGWFPLDETTLDYLSARQKELEGEGIDRIRSQDLESWAARPPGPDAEADYAARIELELSELTPHVSGPDTVQEMTPLGEIEKRRVEIQKAYLVSCVNSRLEDLVEAANVLEGRQVAPGVRFYLAAASQGVQRRAERLGVWKTLLDAGATALPSGCGPCIGLGKGTLGEGEVGISATNRNFKGRMGSREAKCYLASPAVVAASAAAGYIRGPKRWPGQALTYRCQSRPAGTFTEKTATEILDGFPERVRGRLVFLPHDHLNTDGIYSKDYTYREDMTAAMMARVVMENYDPQFKLKVREGDVLVAGFNFGTGSSREQAVTSLQAKGLRLAIAASYSQTYLRNAFNNGFLCIQCPELVGRLKKEFQEAIRAGQKTLIPGHPIEVDFRSGTITCMSQTYSFPPLSRLPQSLVVAGGVENLIRRRLESEGSEGPAASDPIRPKEEL